MAEAKRPAAKKPGAKKPAAKAGIMRVRESFSAQERSGEVYTFQAGDLVRADHRAVKVWPGLFAPVEDFDRPDVEQATAAPGEQRGET